MFGVSKIGFGGGCHWCTEAVFQSLIGVVKVEQGFVASDNDQDTFSEAVLVHFKVDEISLKDLISIHLSTHESTSNHSMRSKYRSAVYTFGKVQAEQASKVLNALQVDFNNQLITKVYPFRKFKPSGELFHDYYYSNPQKPFCKKHISPKLDLLLSKFSNNVDVGKIKNQ